MVIAISILMLVHQCSPEVYIMDEGKQYYDELLINGGIENTVLFTGYVSLLQLYFSKTHIGI